VLLTRSDAPASLAQPTWQLGRTAQLHRATGWAHCERKREMVTIWQRRGRLACLAVHHHPAPDTTLAISMPAAR